LEDIRGGNNEGVGINARPTFEVAESEMVLRRVNT